MPITGLQTVQRVFERLRKPSDLALPYQTILRTVAEKINLYKLDLSLYAQNQLTEKTEWFTPDQKEKVVDDISLPVKVERRPLGSTDDYFADDIPIVNYLYLSDSPGAIAFYGSPATMVFNSSVATLQNYEYRVAYESDLSTGTLALEDNISLPDFFHPMLTLECAYELLDVVEDSSPEWMSFRDYAVKKWMPEVADWRGRWMKFYRNQRGKTRVQKKTFFDGRGLNGRRPMFRG